MNKETITVEKIHNDFKGYPDALGRALQDMDINLESAKRAYDKLSQLEEMGFSQIKQNVKNPKEEFEYSKNEFESINELYYKYGRMYKFISKRGIEHLCEKYNLFHGRIQNFITGIPEKNANEILASQGQDFGYSPILTCYLNDKRFCFTKNVGFDTDYLNIDNMTLTDLAYYTLRIKDEYGNDIVSEHVDNARHMTMLGFDRPMIQIADPSRYFFSSGEPRINTRRVDSNTINSIVSEYKSKLRTVVLDAMKKAQEEIKSCTYSIVGNHSDFSVLETPELKTLEIEMPKLVFPDPIVFKKTSEQDIYAIVTAWDKEASDPLVVNQSFN